MTTEHRSETLYDPAFPYTLRNRLGIGDQAVLNDVEAQLSALRIAEIADEGATGLFDFGHYCTLHARLLGDVYSWAGAPPPAGGAMVGSARNAVRVLGDDLSSPSIDYGRLGGRSLRDSAEYIFGYLQAEGCLLGLPPRRFSARLAAYWCALSSLPVFPRGNARTETVFFHQLCRHSGRRLDTRKLFAHRVEFRIARSTTESTRSRYRLFTTLVHAVVDHGETTEPTCPVVNPLPL